jgi:hypothetical protein
MTDLRIRLILGKYPVLSISPGHFGFKMILDMGNNVRITADVPVQADVKVGDLLTLYTEVLAKEPPNAQPQ